MTDIVRLGREVPTPPSPAPPLRPYSLEWWLMRLTARLATRADSIIRCSDYYDGRQPLRFASEAFTKNFLSRFNVDPRLPTFCSNLMALVVDTHRERLVVEGIRYGDDDDTDSEAWAWWQRHRLDAMSGVAHTEAIVDSIAYVSVWPDPVTGEPTPTVEHPLQMVVETSPGRWWERRAALKQWIDDLGYYRAELHLPNGNPAEFPAGVYRFVTRSLSVRLTGERIAGPMLADWAAAEPFFIPNRLGIVPVVPLPNAPRLARIVDRAIVPDDGRSDIAPVLSNQDAINKYRADALVASEFSAYRQRWLIGLDIPIDPATGKPVESLKAAHDHLWWLGRRDSEDPDQSEIKVGEFSATDLAPFMVAIDKEVKHVATISRTPYHYFLGESTTMPPSGESLAASETGLVRKVEASQIEKAESWEEVFRLNFLWRGDPRGQVTDAEIRWGDAERRSESQHVDSLVKLLALGVPKEVLWEMVPLTPKTIARIKAAQTAASPTPAAPPDEVAGILAAAGVPTI